MTVMRMIIEYREKQDVEFKAAVNKAEKVVIMAFGSIANAPDMPDTWKDAFLAAFAHFPHVQFVLRYSEDDLKERAPPNVLFSKWIPQSDLLQHPKTAAFISHAGYNSLQEAINAGKPIITIPLFGDQPRNGRIAEKHGLGYLVPKGEVSAENLIRALEAVLNDERYTVAARRMNAMLEKKPVQPGTLLVRWTEFLAEFQQLENLVPYGTKLGFVQYHNLDVLFVLFSLVALVLLVVFQVLKLVYRVARWALRRSAKVKTH
uniref:UDP-glucuronosyltransferase n=1 Tax=Steinernema glaseri TaxID=37863 RepID=A0A1I7Z2H8_9BILA